MELNESDKQLIDMKLAAEREFKAQLPSKLTKLNFTTCISKIAPLVLALTTLSLILLISLLMKYNNKSNTDKLTCSKKKEDISSQRRNACEYCERRWK